MERINKKQCPNCRSEKISETHSGILSDKGDGSYPAFPLNDVLCKCKECGEEFFVKK